MSKFPDFFFPQFLAFPDFPFFFSKYWNAKPSKYFALLIFQTLGMVLFFLAFPVFLGKKRGTFRKKMLDKNGPKYQIPGTHHHHITARSRYDTTAVQHATDVKNLIIKNLRLIFLEKK